jgi:hypothetical protein
MHGKQMSLNVVFDVKFFLSTMENLMFLKDERYCLSVVKIDLMNRYYIFKSALPTS